MGSIRDKILKELKHKVRGRLITEEKSLRPYARDQSIYEIFPAAVFIPADRDDILSALSFCAGENIPVTVRSGGSGTAGAALGRGLIISFPRHGPVSRILQFNNDDRTVTVEAGILHDELQRFLRSHNLYLPADPSSGAISLLGGNVATKASGPHAFKHGSIDRYIKHLQFITPSCEVVDTEKIDTLPERIGKAIRDLCKDILSDKDTVTVLDKKKGRKIASGYNLFTFLRHKDTGEHISQLMTGSVGTLGIITAVTLKAEPFVPEKSSMLLYFQNLRQACDATEKISHFPVATIEIINNRTLQLIKEKKTDLPFASSDNHLLFIEFEGEERFAQIEEIKKLLKRKKYLLSGEPEVAEAEETRANLWKIRKSLLPSILNYSPDLKALSLVNDVGVDVKYLADFIIDVERIFERYELPLAVYGHAGSGNLHLRPLFNIKDKDLSKKLLSIAEEVYETVLKYDGTITAEHGMGRLRAPFLKKEWGEKIIGYMKRVKECFDPHGILNPDVMFSERTLTDDMIPFS